MTLAYGLYMAEQEGYLDNLREKNINNIIEDVKKYPNKVMPNLVFFSICQQNGISYESLTDEELRRIKENIKN